jgi:ABC-type Na+ efflux pump permease subunit
VRSVAELYAILVGDDGGFFLLLVAIAAMLPALVGALRSQNTRLVLVWAIVPAALAIVVSFMQPCFVPRFLIPCLPATTLLTAAGLEKLAIYGHRYARLAAVVLLALLIFGMLNGVQAIGA